MVVEPVKYATKTVRNSKIIEKFQTIIITKTVTFAMKLSQEQNRIIFESKFVKPENIDVFESFQTFLKFVTHKP